MPNALRNALVVTIFFSGFVMFIFSPLVEPNYQGFPVVPIIMFVLSVAFYALTAKHLKTLLVTITILVILFAYIGYWFYTYKMPLSSLVVTLVPIDVRNCPTFQSFGGNQCDIHFDLFIWNPTGTDTPPFMIENVDFYINDVKLERWTYSMWGWHRGGPLGNDQGHWYYGTHLIVRSNETLVVSRDFEFFSISIYSNDTELEEGNIEDIWGYVANGHFTLSISGYFTSRPNFKSGDFSRQSLQILAMTKFQGSCKFD